MLEYSRSIKLTAESPAEVQISFYGIQVCCGNHSYLLLTCHWTWRYITITNSWVFSLQLLCTHWPTYAYLLTITLVIYLVLSLYLALTNARVAHTITYIYISSTYYKIIIVLFYPVYSFFCFTPVQTPLHLFHFAKTGRTFEMCSWAQFNTKLLNVAIYHFHDLRFWLINVSIFCCYNSRLQIRFDWQPWGWFYSLSMHKTICNAYISPSVVLGSHITTHQDLIWAWDTVANKTKLLKAVGTTCIKIFPAGEKARAVVFAHKGVELQRAQMNQSRSDLGHQLTQTGKSYEFTHHFWLGNCERYSVTLVSHAWPCHDLLRWWTQPECASWMGGCTQGRLSSSHSELIIEWPVRVEPAKSGGRSVG